MKFLWSFVLLWVCGSALVSLNEAKGFGSEADLMELRPQACWDYPLTPDPPAFTPPLSAGIAGYTTALSRKTILFLTRCFLAPESSLTSRPVTAPIVRSCSPSDSHFKPASFLSLLVSICHNKISFLFPSHHPRMFPLSIHLQQCWHF